jgi:hypothetical protein
VKFIDDHIADVDALFEDVGHAQIRTHVFTLMMGR